MNYLDSTVDKEWRLRIPKKFHELFSRYVIFGVDDNNCVFMEGSSEREENYDSFVEEIKIRQREKNGYYYEEKSVKIPRQLRGTISFFFDRNVILKPENGILKILPRP